MAIFNATPNPTQDPNWLNQSREYDKPKSLPADNTMGTLFANLGELAGQAVTVTDAGIQRSAKAELYSTIDAIRDAHGSNVTPDEVPAIAGTGARGARYEAAGGEDFAAGSGDEVPAGAKSKLDGLQRLAQAREAGKLSDSHYFSALETAVREVRARYPGYRDQIDSMVSTITGVTPANALRSSLLRDMNARAAAASAGDKAGESWYKTDHEYFGLLFPGRMENGQFIPGITKEQAIARRAEIEPMIGQLKADQLQLKIDGARMENGTTGTKALAAKQAQSNTLFTNHANEIVSTFMTGVSNVEGMNFKEIEQRAKQLASQGEKADPAAVQKAAQDFAMIEQGLITKMDQRLRAPLAPGSANSLATYLKPAEIEAVQQGALAQVRVVRGLLGVKEIGPAMAAANILKHQTDQDFRTISERVPALRTVQAMERLDPVTRGLLLQGSGVLPELTKAMVDTSWMKVADPAVSKVPPPITDIVDKMGGLDGKTVSPKAQKVLLDGILKLMEHPDPAVAARAVESVYADPKFLAEVNGPGTTNSDRLNLYTKLGNPEFTKKMIKLNDTHPQAWVQYSQLMEKTFGVVANQGIDDLQQALSYRNYEVNYDPKTMMWSAKTKADGVPTASGKYADRVGSDPAAFYVSKVNQAMTVIKPILEKQYGERAGAQMLTLLKQNGLDVNAEKKGPIIEELLKKIPEWAQPELLDPRAKRP